MPGIYFIISLKLADLLQRLHHGVHIAAVKIRSAAAPAEKGISCKKGVLNPEADTAGCVPGRLHHMKNQAGFRDLIAVLIILSSGGERKRKMERLPYSGIVLFVHINGDTGLFRNGSYRTDVVKVTVCEENSITDEMILLQIVHNGVAFVTRVDHDRMKRIFICDDISVCFQITDRKCFNQHGSSFPAVISSKPGRSG